MTMQITPDRLKEIQQLLSEWLNKRYATLKEVQSLLGKLSFATSTVWAGRAFVSRIINSLKTYPVNGRRKVPAQLKKDMEWWMQFMEGFDGISILPPINWDAPDKILSSDACLKSCGGWSDGEAFYCKFPDWLKNNKEISINELELVTFVVALKLWVDRIQNRNVLAYCDNAVSVEVVNAGRANNRFAQACLRKICFITA